MLELQVGDVGAAGRTGISRHRVECFVVTQRHFTRVEDKERAYPTQQLETSRLEREHKAGALLSLVHQSTHTRDEYAVRGDRQACLVLR